MTSENVKHGTAVPRSVEPLQTKGWAMIKGLVGAVLGAVGAWFVAYTRGYASADMSVLRDLGGDVWGLTAGILGWLLHAPEYPARALVVVCAGCGFVVGLRAKT